MLILIICLKNVNKKFISLIFNYLHYKIRDTHKASLFAEFVNVYFSIFFIMGVGKELSHEDDKFVCREHKTGPVMMLKGNERNLGLRYKHAHLTLAIHDITVC